MFGRTVERPFRQAMTISRAKEFSESVRRLFGRSLPAAPAKSKVGDANRESICSKPTTLSIIPNGDKTLGTSNSAG